MKSTERCEHCDEPLVKARVRVYRLRGKSHVLFERVPAQICRACGQRFFDAQAVEAMEYALNHPTSKKRIVRLTVIPA